MGPGRALQSLLITGVHQPVSNLLSPVDPVQVGLVRYKDPERFKSEGNPVV